MTATIEKGSFDRSAEQRMEGLAKANAVRGKRAELKQELKAGRRTLLPLLADPPGWLANAKVEEFLLAVPKVGRSKAGAILNVTGVSPRKTFEGLTGRQRRCLSDVLRSRGVR